MSNILLVEDDPSIYRMYQKVFALEGFTLELTTDGQMAMDRLKVFTPDIIILDVMMPKMNGMEVLTKLKQDPATKAIPVIMLTNLSDMGTTNRAVAMGASQYVVKSDTDPDQLVALVRGLLKTPA
jgi:DNA-binding response OmpR family regulator